MKRKSEYGFKVGIQTSVNTDSLDIFLFRPIQDGRCEVITARKDGSLNCELMDRGHVLNPIFSIPDTAEMRDMFVTFGSAIMDHFGERTENDTSDVLRGRIIEMEKRIEYMKELHARQLRYLEGKCSNRK